MVPDFDLVEVARDHPDHLAARIERGIGKKAHQTDLPAPKDDGYARLCEQLSQALGGVAEGGIDIEAGAAVNA